MVNLHRVEDRHHVDPYVTFTFEDRFEQTRSTCDSGSYLA